MYPRYIMYRLYRVCWRFDLLSLGQFYSFFLSYILCIQEIKVKSNEVQLYNRNRYQLWQIFKYLPNKYNVNNSIAQQTAYFLVIFIDVWRIYSPLHYTKIYDPSLIDMYAVHEYIYKCVHAYICTRTVGKCNSSGEITVSHKLECILLCDFGLIWLPHCKKGMIAALWGCVQLFALLLTHFS